jgi:hypothetical protein
MKYIRGMFLCCFITAFFISLPCTISADIISTSTKIMKIYLEKDGEPYEKQVKFKVTCYGHDFSVKAENDDISISKEVFSFSGVYQYYPYRYTENYYGRGLRIDYCIIEGKLGTGEKFTIKYPDLLNSDACSYTGSGEQVCNLRFDISRKIPVIKKSGVTRIVSPLYETRFLMSLLLTMFIELIIILLFIKCIYKLKGPGYADIILIGVLASMLTLPYIWFVLPVYIRFHLIAGELFAIIAEAGIYYRFLTLGFARALLVSAAANIVSFVSGLVLFS